MAKKDETQPKKDSKVSVAKKDTSKAVEKKTATKSTSKSVTKSSSKATTTKATSKPVVKDTSLDKTIIAKAPVVKKAEKVAKPTKVKKEKKPRKPKKPKGRVRVGPLAIVIVLIVGGIVAERLFLDVIVKNVLVSVIQSQYGAKCDIEKVDVDLWGGSFVIEKFALADVASPMRNLFEFSRSSVDFDVTQIFLGRFVADELALEGFMLGTERSVSGELPRILKESEPSEDTKEGKFALAISEKKSEFSSSEKNIIEQAVETYNPENMMASYMEQLKVPGVVENSQKQVEEITAYWQGAAPGLEKSGQELFSSVEEVRMLLETDNVDIKTITDGVSSIQKLISQSQSLQAQVGEVSTRLESDIETVENLSSSIQDAIKSDTSLIETEIGKITSFSFSDAQGMVGSTLEGFFIGALGDYYPMVQKGLALLSNAKADAQSEKRDEEKKFHERLSGRTVQFNSEMPSFLIRNAVFSGSDSGAGISVSGNAYDISNNPDLLQKPALANVDLTLADFSGTLDAVVDLRSETENYPVEAAFTGSGLDTSSITESGTIGLPSIGGNADIKAEAKFELAGDFDLSANFDFNPALLSTAEFEPASVYDIYSNVLGSISSFYVQSDIAFSFDKGMNIKLDTNVDKQIADGLSTALNAEVEALKENLQVQVQEYLASYTDGYMENLANFGASRDSILNLQDGLGGIDSELENIKAELEKRIRDQASGVLQSGASDSGVGGRLQGLFN